MEASTNWMYQLFCTPMLPATAWWKAGIMCEPISSTNTGSANTAATISARRRPCSSAAWRRAAASAAAPRIQRAGLVAGGGHRLTSACGATAPATSTWARSVARLTLAARTPGTAFSARSTRPTHEAQVMPETANSMVLAATA